MKSFLTILLSFLLMFAVTAQDFGNKNQVELSGNVSVTSETAVFDGETDDNSTTTIAIEPMLGYFIVDNVELGFMPLYQSTSYDESCRDTWGLFVVPQYVFQMKKLYPFLGIYLGYSSTTYDNGTTDATYSGFSYGGVGGIKIQIANHVLLNFGLQYLFLNMEPEDWDGDRVGANQFGFNGGFSVYFN